MSFLYLRLTHAISSLLCRINRRHQIISLKTRICRSGSKGLHSDCICICDLLWLSYDLWWWFIMHVMMVYCELWWWFIVNCDDGLLCLWHIIMPVMMVCCELWWFIVNWEGSVIRDRLVKKEGICRFAECNTRQRDALPSVKPKHSAKRPISVILRTFFAECFGFAECIVLDKRQSDHKIWPCALVCQVFWHWHSAKFRNIAECFGVGARQSLETLSSVLALALGKV